VLRFLVQDQELQILEITLTYHSTTSLSAITLFLKNPQVTSMASSIPKWRGGGFIRTVVAPRAPEDLLDIRMTTLLLPHLACLLAVVDVEVALCVFPIGLVRYRQTTIGRRRAQLGGCSQFGFYFFGWKGFGGHRDKLDMLRSAIGALSASPDEIRQDPQFLPRRDAAPHCSHAHFILILILTSVVFLFSYSSLDNKVLSKWSIFT
jgi:hypothetical protein